MQVEEGVEVQDLELRLFRDFDFGERVLVEFC